jgi:hypothetical protein
VRVYITSVVERNGLLWTDYAMGEDGKKLSFPTVRDAIIFLVDRNWTIKDLRKLDFNFEGEK